MEISSHDSDKWLKTHGDRWRLSTKDPGCGTPGPIWPNSMAEIHGGDHNCLLTSSWGPILQVGSIYCCFLIGKIEHLPIERENRSSFFGKNHLSGLKKHITPWKIKGAITHFRSENDLNQTSMRTCSMLIFRGVIFGVQVAGGHYLKQHG